MTANLQMDYKLRVDSVYLSSFFSQYADRFPFLFFNQVKCEKNDDGKLKWNKKKKKCLQFQINHRQLRKNKDGLVPINAPAASSSYNHYC